MSLIKWILVAVVLFSIGIVLGLIMPESGSILSGDIAGLQQLSSYLLSLPPFVTALFIFFKNAFSLLFGFAFSPFLLLVPIIALVLNGWLIGFVSVTVIDASSVSVLLAGILPHGIIEIPAFMLGMAAAIAFGTGTIIAVIRSDGARFRQTFLRNVKYLGIAVALLLPAAFIEAFITPLVLKWAGI